jgi:hypothetical protein
MPSGPPGYTLSPLGQPLIANERRSTPFPARFVELARQILSEAGDASLTSTRFLLIVETALAAIHLLFTAALHEPAEPELDVFFETFVRACVPPSCSGGQQ